MGRQGVDHGQSEGAEDASPSGSACRIATSAALYTRDAERRTASRRLAVNGAAVKPAIENGYAAITRTWKTGDTIEFDAADAGAARAARATRSRADQGPRRAARTARSSTTSSRSIRTSPGAARPSAPLTTEWRARPARRRDGHHGHVRRRHADDGDSELRALQPQSAGAALVPPPPAPPRPAPGSPQAAAAAATPPPPRPAPPPPTSVVWLRETT